MAKFSEIPNEIIRKIALEHLENEEDYEAFRAVCSGWRSETEDVKYICPSKSTQLPWLMLADLPTTPYRRFYSLSKLGFRKFHLPKFDAEDEEEYTYLSSKGWLISLGLKRGLIHFIDVFSSHNVIQAPNLPFTWAWFYDVHFSEEDEFESYEAHPEYLHNIIISKRPCYYSSYSSLCSCCNTNDFEVAMIYHQHKIIAFWRPGQQDWIQPDDDENNNIHIEEVCFFRGEFYSIDKSGQVIAYGNHTPKKPRIIVSTLPSRLGLTLTSKFYIVALETTLLVIHKMLVRDFSHGHGDGDNDNKWTTSFEVSEVNVDDSTAVEVEDIGDRALFIGHNSTFFVNASSDTRGCTSNCIYFTNDYRGTAKAKNMMGIFSLEQNKVVAPLLFQDPSQFSYFAQPLWMQLPPH